MVSSFNQTILELKLHSFDYKGQYACSFNQTILELKLV